MQSCGNPGPDAGSHRPPRSRPCVLHRSTIRSPGRVVFRQQILGVVSQPTVAVSPFVRDIGQSLAGDSVAAAEDRLVRPDLIEPRPHRRRLGILDHEPVESLRRAWGLLADQANAVQCGVFVPGDCRLDGLNDPAIGILDLHQELHDADGLSATERGQLVTPRFGRGKGLLIVLCAPDGLRAINDDLALEDTLDPLLDSFSLRASESPCRQTRRETWPAAISRRTVITPIIAPSLNVMCFA